MVYRELLECGNLAIADAAMKTEAVFASHSKAHVGISGGADSDVMLDLCERVRTVSPIEIRYEWNDTGIEYRATKEHLDYLEDRYGIKIHRVRAVKTVPVCCKQYGVPFISKMCSQHMHTLQTHDFEWDDKPLAILRKMYPDAPLSSLRWWSNDYTSKGMYTSYCINRNKWLREYVISNHPSFKISGKCCHYAKKLPAEKSARENGCDVRLMGTRRSEGGVRSLSSKCFEPKDGGPDFYKPVYWLNNEDKAFYVERFGIEHSDCYAWGFTRTGCVGCPFNRQCMSDLSLAERHEPNVVRAARRVFADSYEYTLAYREYVKAKEHGGQMTIFDILGDEC